MRSIALFAVILLCGLNPAAGQPASGPTSAPISASQSTVKTPNNNKAKQCAIPERPREPAECLVGDYTPAEALKCSQALDDLAAPVRVVLTLQEAGTHFQCHDVDGNLSPCPFEAQPKESGECLFGDASTSNRLACCRHFFGGDRLSCETAVTVLARAETLQKGCK